MNNDEQLEKSELPEQERVQEPEMPRAEVFELDLECEAQKLDSRIIPVWRWANAVGMGLLLLAISGGMSAIWMFTDVPRWMPILVELVVVSLFFVNVVWWPRWAFETWSYLSNDQVLELRYGVVWQRSVVIPLSRLQHIDLHRGPIERYYGLGSLEVFTAGTQNASHKVPGLEMSRAQALREELVRAAQLESP